MFSTLFTGLKIVLTPSTFLLITAGTILGVIFGAMPGVSASMAVALALPFAYAMNPVIAIAFLVAVYCASITGGGITAILFQNGEAVKTLVGLQPKEALEDLIK